MSNEQNNESSELIQIPASALVHCPKVDFKLARVGACVGCEHFTGLADRFPGGSHPFAVRYTVGCVARPTMREIKELAE